MILEFLKSLPPRRICANYIMFALVIISIIISIVAGVSSDYFNRHDLQEQAVLATDWFCFSIGSMFIFALILLFINVGYLFD